jgi:beta-glucosidase
VQLWYAGEEAGSGLVDVLFGRAPPSGRLPLTFYRNAYLQRVGPITDLAMVSEGTGRTYRYLAPDAAARGLVAYWFGHGLSYTRFEYSNASAALDGGSGGARIAVDVRNVGAVDSSEVVTAYLTVPSQAGLATPFFNLVAFTKLPPLVAGAPPTRVELAVDSDGLATTLSDGSRQVTPGSYCFTIGRLPADDGAEQSRNYVTADLTINN